MGYPNVTNPSEKLKFEDVCVAKVEGGYYRVSAQVNGAFAMRDMHGNDEDDAISYFKKICQKWAKYSPNYEELEEK